MRSTRARAHGAARRDGQSGVSLIEAVVASALMGIGVVTGLTAWDTAAMSASRAVSLAWAQCIVRAELDAIVSSPYNDSTYAVPDRFGPPPGGDDTVVVQVTQVPGRPIGSPGSESPGDEQLVTVRAYDPTSHAQLALHMVQRTRAMGGARQLNDALDEVMLGCPQR